MKDKISIQYKLVCAFIIFLLPIYPCISQTKNQIQQQFILSDLGNKLKNSKIKYIPDTTNMGLGVYQRFANTHFDIAKMKKNFTDDTSYFTVNAKFFLQQQFVAVLENYFKHISSRYLKIVEYTTSKALSKNWEKDSDEQELKMIKNSLIIMYENQNKKIELMIINFSERTNKIIFISSLGTSAEDSKFIEGLLSNK